MDPEETRNSEGNYNCEEESRAPNESNSSDLKGVSVLLEGTHTGCTSTDPSGNVWKNLATTEPFLSEPFGVPGYTKEHLLIEAQQNKAERTKQPVEEIIQEMSDNIQSIMDMFGHRSRKNSTKGEAHNLTTQKQVTFQETNTAKKIPNKSNTAQFEQYLEPKNHYVDKVDSSKVEGSLATQLQNGSGSSQCCVRTEVNMGSVVSRYGDRDTPNYNQRQLEYQSSIFSPLFGKEPSDIENANEIRDEKTFDISDVRCGRLLNIKPNEVIIPICDNAGSGIVSLAPCENVFHTVHIEAASSPTSSVMYRSPLCSRLWSVITDFITAICLCLQVNRDCIFCLGFFVAFVVSASFLTAFFYRALSVEPQAIQHFHSPQQSQEILRKNNF